MNKIKILLLLVFTFFGKENLFCQSQQDVKWFIVSFSNEMIMADSITHTLTDSVTMSLTVKYISLDNTNEFQIKGENISGETIMTNLIPIIIQNEGRYIHNLNGTLIPLTQPAILKIKISNALKIQLKKIKLNLIYSNGSSSNPLVYEIQ